MRTPDQHIRLRTHRIVKFKQDAETLIHRHSIHNQRTMWQTRFESPAVILKPRHLAVDKHADFMCRAVRVWLTANIRKIELRNLRRSVKYNVQFAVREHSTARHCLESSVPMRRQPPANITNCIHVVQKGIVRRFVWTEVGMHVAVSKPLRTHVVQMI